MTLEKLQRQLNESPLTVEFDQVMATISEHYHYTPTEFINAGTSSAAGTNEGSCKIFALGKLLALNEDQTLACFGQYYRKDVQENPTGNDHGNIRSFIKQGWSGIDFNGEALRLK